MTQSILKGDLRLTLDYFPPGYLFTFDQRFEAWLFSEHRWETPLRLGGRQQEGGQHPRLDLPPIQYAVKLLMFCLSALMWVKADTCINIS